MAHLEVIRFYDNGRKRRQSVLSNAAHFSRSVWRLLESKHLPPFTPPGDTDGVSRSRVDTMGNAFEQEMKKIWKLFDTDTVPLEDRLVLGITFDRSLISIDQFQQSRELGTAFMNNNPNFSAPNELKLILEKMYYRQSGGLKAVGFDQSVEPQWKKGARYVELSQGDNIGRILV